MYTWSRVSNCIAIASKFITIDHGDILLMLYTVHMTSILTSTSKCSTLSLTQQLGMLYCNLTYDVQCKTTFAAPQCSSLLQLLFTFATSLGAGVRVGYFFITICADVPLKHLCIRVIAQWATVKEFGPNMWCVITGLRQFTVFREWVLLVVGVRELLHTADVGRVRVRVRVRLTDAVASPRKGSLNVRGHGCDLLPRTPQ